MRRIILFCVLLMPALVQAGAGIWGSAVLLRVNGTGRYYNNTAPGGSNNFGPSGFQGASLGSFVGNTGALMIGGGALRTWKNGGGNVCGGTVFYTVYPQGSRPVSPVFTAIGISDFGCDCVGGTFACTSNSPCGSGDQTWFTNTPAFVDITSGRPQGTYVLEVYFSITGDQNTSACNLNNAFDNNGGSATNYTATFTITSVLPLRLQSFEARERTGQVELQWTVADNEEAQAFEVQRASGTGAFQTVGTVMASRTRGEAVYRFTEDAPASEGLVQYRLKLRFVNGAEKYSVHRALRLSGKGFSVQLQKNPVSVELPLSVRAERHSVLVMTIVNAQGGVVYTARYPVGAGSSTITLPAERLSSGAYSLLIVRDGETARLPFVKH